MNSEDKFKRSVKELLDAESFRYDAQNWEKARAILDRKDRRKRFIFFILLAGLGTGILLTGILHFRDEPAFTTQKRERASRHQAADVQTNERPASPGGSAAPASANVPASLEIESRIPGEPDQAVTPSPVVISTEPAAPVSVAPRAVKFSKEPEQPRNAVVATPTSVTFESRPEPQKNEPVTETTAKKDPITIGVTNQNIKDKKETNDNTPTSVTDPTITKTAPPDTAAKIIAPVAAEILTLTPIVPAGTLKPQTDTAAVVPTPTIAAETPTVSPDTAQTAAASGTQVIPAMNFIFIEGGFFGNGGWNSGDGSEAQGVNPYAGVSYLNRISDKLAFSLGTYFTMLTNLRSGSKTIKSSVIVFGEESEVTRITPISASYLSIPVRAHYLINEKNAVTGGVSVLYLLNVRSIEETYTERLNRQENHVEVKTYGYTAGFRLLNPAINIGYRRKLTGKIWLDAEVLFGISDLREDAFFGLNMVERPAGLKLTLCYKLLKK
jgi:hypothetical protein